MIARGLVFQCGACRSLVSAHSVVADPAQERAGLACAVCGGITWLPSASASGQVVDVHTTASSPSLQLASSTALVASTATSATTATPATPANTAATANTAASAASAATVALANRFTEDQRARIGDRLRTLAASGAAQEELSMSFDRLLGLWQSEAEHKALLTKASLVGELAFVGQRYRSILDEVPGDPQAKKAQTELLGLAMATMSRDKDLGATVRGGINKNVAAVVIVILTAIICAGLVIYLPRLLRPDTGDETLLDVPGGRPPVVEER